MTFPINRFPAIFASHLKFLHKTQKKHLSQKQYKIEPFQRKILTPQDIRRVMGQFFPKNIFQLFLATILNFWVKGKYAFISETVRDRAILANFTPPGYLQSHLAIFPKNHFPTIFCGHLEFQKRKKCIYL